MRFGNRGPRASGTGQRRKPAFRPDAEGLEEKLVLSQVFLGAGTPVNLAGQTTIAPNGPQTIAGQLPFIADSFGTTTQTQGNQTTDPGLGVMETGSLQAQGVGYAVRRPRRHERRRQQRLPGRCPDRDPDRHRHQPEHRDQLAGLPRLRQPVGHRPDDPELGLLDAGNEGRQHQPARQQHPDQPLHQPRPALQLQFRRDHLHHEPVAELPARCLRGLGRAECVLHRGPQLRGGRTAVSGLIHVELQQPGEPDGRPR